MAERPRAAARRVTFTFDGHVLEASDGANLAAELMRLGHRHLRDSPLLGMPHGAFCLMGSCQECVVWIDGRRHPACRAVVRAGLEVHP
jgi:predicted molibdopterin-dependent oxidoreductase YjgC